MDIKILKNFENYKNTLLTDNLVLETLETDSEYSGIKQVKYMIFNIDENSRHEIMPQVDKYIFGIIKNVSVNSEFIYFFGYEELDDDKIKINVYRYNYVSEEREIVFSFEDDKILYPVAKRLKIFVINDIYLIIQHEYIKTNKAETYSGFFEFRSFLYNCKDEQCYSIVDENIAANGIMDMIPISENQCIMKTGYSLLEDERYDLLEKDEASVESISFVNMGQLISDILIMQTNITLDTIDQAYYDKTLPYIETQNDYLIYSRVDNIEKSEEVIFYNYNTKEMINCINKNVTKFSDMANHCIIGGEPYICLTKSTGIEFINLKKAKVEFRFDSELKYITVKIDIFVFSGETEKGLIRKQSSYVELYGYPQQNVLLHEKGECFDCLSPNKENIYLFME